MTDDNQEWKAFTPKPKHLKAEYIKRKEKWEQEQEKEKDISHRRFNLTLQVPQLVAAFKRCVHEGEISTSDLITVYRVVLGKILQDPDLDDADFISMYKQISPRANEVYARRARKLRQIK